MYSTISLFHGVGLSTSLSCGGIGTCNGSFDGELSFAESDYCHESSDCPRLWRSSSVAHTRAHYAMDFQGAFSPGWMTSVAVYQRPAL